MSQVFKLIKKEFNETYQEWQWTYLCLSPFIFNQKNIEYLTITDHYQQEHQGVINNELILKVITGLPLRINPRTKYEHREIFVWEYIPDQSQEYRLIFWFKDQTTNHLWIRNCYRIN